MLISTGSPQILLRIATNHVVTIFESEINGGPQNLLINFGSDSGSTSKRDPDKDLMEVLNTIRNSCVRSLPNRIRDRKFKDLISISVQGLAITSEDRFYYAVTFTVNDEMVSRAGLDVAESVEALRATIRTYIRDAAEILSILKSVENKNFGAFSIENALEVSGVKKFFSAESIAIAKQTRKFLGLDFEDNSFEIAIPITPEEIDQTKTTKDVEFEVASIELTKQKSVDQKVQARDLKVDMLLRNCRAKSASSLKATSGDDGCKKDIEVKGAPSEILILSVLSRLKIDAEVKLNIEAIRNRGNVDKKYTIASMPRISNLGLNEISKFKEAVSKLDISTGESAITGFYKIFGFEAL
jgi:hypothetical protein